MTDMYYKYIGESNRNFINGKWYKCVGSISLPGAFIDEEGDRNGFVGHNNKRFDFSNPSKRDEA